VYQRLHGLACGRLPRHGGPAFRPLLLLRVSGGRHRPAAEADPAEYLLYRAALPVLDRKYRSFNYARADRGQRDVFASGVRTSSTSVAFPVLNDS
jgi:hypothetical protein